MKRLNPEKLHVTSRVGVSADSLVLPRCYTLTHSDATGDMFLTIDLIFDDNQVAGWYTALMRDEVLAEWRESEGSLSLHCFCHVSGGLVLGPAAFRYAIFRRELPLALEAICFGDRPLYRAKPELVQSSVIVHFQSRCHRYHRIQDWGVVADYWAPAA